MNSHSSRVLLVDDEAAFVAVLRYSLERQGFQVDHVANGQEALSHIRTTQPNGVLLEWMLRDISGIEVCQRLRSRLETKGLSVIVLTGRAGDQYAVEALNAGADDYMVKPISVAELLARIRALLRRTSDFRGAGCLYWREIAMDLVAVRVTRCGREVRLGPTEFRLLKLLMQNPTCIFSRFQRDDPANPLVRSEPIHAGVQHRRLETAQGMSDRRTRPRRPPPRRVCAQGSSTRWSRKWDRSKTSRNIRYPMIGYRPWCPRQPQRFHARRRRRSRRCCPFDAGMRGNGRARLEPGRLNSSR